MVSRVVDMRRTGEHRRRERERFYDLGGAARFFEFLLQIVANKVNVCYEMPVLCERRYLVCHESTRWAAWSQGCGEPRIEPHLGRWSDGSRGIA